MQASMKESQKLLIREKKLKKEIAYFFQKLMQRILYKLEKDWDSGILNINDYTEIVDIAHKDYFDILYTHVQREYYRARKIGENRVNRAIIKMATKADTPTINISRTDLWGTMSEVEKDLENMTFQASDKTLERVKEDKITQILHQGYVEGRNGTEVGREIKREFSKLKTYEAERIARTELHSAHEKGLLDQYKEMDVQYKQWDAHIDNRTRSSHIDLNGEITTIDGTFSNGLTRPGDKNGPIKEWIHCRCTLSPFLMPIDKMAPEGALHFRESDLVDLDLDFNIDDYTLADALSGNWGKTKINTVDVVEEAVNWDFISEFEKLPEKEQFKQLGKVLDKEQRKSYQQLYLAERRLVKELESAVDEKDIKELTEQLNDVRVRKRKLVELIYKPKNKIPDIDESEYIEDVQHTGFSIEKTKLEKKQIKIQEGMDVSIDERLAYDEYLGEKYYLVHGFLEPNKEWETMMSVALDPQERIRFYENVVRNIDVLMDRSHGLTQKTTLYSARDWDVNLRPGDVGIWKRYTSTSYSKDSAEGFMTSERYLVKILADEGQKGLAANDERFASFKHEHEFTLPRNQEYIVLDVNHETRTATIKLI